MATFRKYWGDCPYKRYIATNELAPSFEGFVTLRLGKDRSWSDNLSKALDLIAEPYVLLFLEDLMLLSRVDSRLLSRAMEWVRDNRPQQLKLNATERADERVNDIIGRAREGAIYRTSTVLSLWKRDVLLSLLRPGESAWQFEIDGSSRSDAFPGFYSTYRDCFPVVNSVIKGSWRRRAVRALAARGIEVDLAARARLTAGAELGFLLREMRSRLFKLVPMGYRRRFRLFLLQGHR